ncbi:transcriptional repressor NrdR [Bacillus sp. V2I10]|nr:transcriptional repressor NrdR [Bacillus sp. V2I10]
MEQECLTLGLLMKGNRFEDDVNARNANIGSTTFEKVEEIPLIVVKKEGVREEFSKDKILRGLIKACEKRPVPLTNLEEIVQEIEKELRNQGISEVNSEDIGEMVMDRLAHVDEVAYVRFASVYRQFKDINVFIQELSELIKKVK